MSDYEKIKNIVSNKMLSFQEEKSITSFYNETVNEMSRYFHDAQENFKPEFRKKIPPNLSKNKVVNIFMKNGFKFVIHHSRFPEEITQTLVFDFSA
jgi:hypothetical protein